MTDNLRKRLSSDKYDPDEYVHQISAEGEGERDLVENRQKIQSFSDETALALKKNVYRHYEQFIETAKEISFLEGEMYQLSHILADQKALMNSMVDLSRQNREYSKQSEEKKLEEEQRRTLACLLDKVEGCSALTKVPGRNVVFDGDLVELDPDTYTQKERVHAFLLNDTLMIASWIPNKRGPVQYKFQALYELDSLAVVNIRDISNTFKILIFPDCHVYQTDSAKTKRQWLDILEQTKRAKLTANSQHTDSGTLRLTPGSVDSNNPFFEPSANQLYRTSTEADLMQVDWLREMPEDLDVCIAQRDFEAAVQLIYKTNKFLDNVTDSNTAKEFRGRLEMRAKQLTDALEHELRVSPDRTLHGGPTAARRAISLLIALGRSSQACRYFLQGRSSVIRQAMRQKIEGATNLYVSKLCCVFFTHVIDSLREFQRAFSSTSGCNSAFVVWSRREMQQFVSVFSRHVFSSKTNLTLQAECVTIAKTHCMKLRALGLDLTFVLDKLLVKDTISSLHKTRDQLIESSKLRLAEEKWRPVKLEGNSALEGTLNDIKCLGFNVIQSYIQDDVCIQLTASTISFTKAILTFLTDALQLFVPDVTSALVSSVTSVFKHHTDLIAISLKSADVTDKEREFISKNLSFMGDSLLQNMERNLQKTTGQHSSELSGIHIEVTRLRLRNKPSSAGLTKPRKH